MELVSIDPERRKEFKPRFWLSSIRLLVLVMLTGVLAGIISTRAQRHNPQLVQPMHTAFVVLIRLLLVFSLVPLALSIWLYKKHGNKSQIIGALGGIALVLGMLLSELAPDDNTMTAIAYVLYAVSLVISIRGIIKGKRAIARLEADAAEKSATTS